MKAIIIDDEPLARMMIKEYLQSYREIVVVEECSNGFEGLKTVEIIDKIYNAAYQK